MLVSIGDNLIKKKSVEAKNVNGQKKLLGPKQQGIENRVLMKTLLAMETGITDKCKTKSSKIQG